MYAILLLLALNPASQPVIDLVDRVELSHVFTEDGELLFDQLVWYEFDLQLSRYQVVDWRLLRGVRHSSEASKARWKLAHPDLPYVPDWIGGHATPHQEQCGWVSEWWDEKSRKHRRVIATTCLESAACFDIEILERQELPESERRGLR